SSRPILHSSQDSAKSHEDGVEGGGRHGGDAGPASWLVGPAVNNRRSSSSAPPPRSRGWRADSRGPQRLIIRCALSEYRPPCTVIWEAALSMSPRSPSVSSTAAAATFSCKRCLFVVPGIGTIQGFWV